MDWLCWVCLALFTIFNFRISVSQHQADVTNTTLSRKVLGLILETCENEQEKLSDLRLLIRNYKVDHVWHIQCKDYIELSNIFNVLNQVNVSHLIMTARRETLRFAESALKRLNVKEWTAIPTNNDVLITGLTKSQSQINKCKDRAGGKHFWGLMMTLLPDVVDNWQWRNLYLYVDEMFGLSEVKQVYSAFLSYQKIASLKLIMTTSAGTVAEFLTRLAHWDRGVREVKAVILACSHQTTKKVIEEASRMRLFSVYFRWLIFDNGTNEVLKSFKLTYDTDVVIIRHTNRMTLETSIGNALEMASKEPIVISTVAPAVTTKKPYVFHTNNASNNKTSVVQNTCFSDSYIADATLHINQTRTNTKEKEYLPSDLHLEFLRVKKRSDAGLPNMELIGEWTVATGMTKAIQQNYDLDGYNLQVVAIHCPPYVFVHRSIDGRHTFTGYLIDVLEALSILMNFKYNITVPFDHSYGRCEGRLCSGIIGMLVRKEADIALANLTPTGTRVKLMDFSNVAVDNAGLGMLLRRPSKSDANAIKAYIMPFSFDVSICVAVAIPLCGIFLHVAMKGGAAIRRGTEFDDCHQESVQQIKDNRSLGRCLFAAIQSFGQQGIDIIPSTVSGRVVFGVMWLFSLFIMSSYTANLISYFTSSTVTWPFKSLQEVYDSRYYQIGFLKGTTYLDDIQGDNTTVLTKIWNRIEKQRFTTLVDDLEEGVERVRAESFILVHETRMLEYIAARDCEFAVISEKYLSAPMTLAFQKESQFQRPISFVLLKISESGLLQRLRNRWWPPTFDCTIASQTFSSISLWGVLSVYGVLMNGLVIGLLILGLEKGFATQRVKKKLLVISKMANIPEVVPKLNLTIGDRISQALHLKQTSDHEQPSTSQM